MVSFPPLNNMLKFGGESPLTRGRIWRALPRLGTRWVVDAGPEAGGVPPFPGGFRPLLCVFFGTVVLRGQREVLGPVKPPPPVPALLPRQVCGPSRTCETQAVFPDVWRGSLRTSPRMDLLPYSGSPQRGRVSGCCFSRCVGTARADLAIGIRPAAYAPESTKLGHGDPFLGAGESPLGKPSGG